MPDPTLDLTRLALPDRNTVVFSRFSALAPGQSIVVTTDAPPWLLYHQLRTERLDEVAWEDVERGPERFVFRLTRVSQGQG